MALENKRTGGTVVSEQLLRLLAIMARLRGPDGCEWDRAQSFKTIAAYTIEEAYEVADAIDRGAIKDLREELGDLLLQVVFHARIAEEGGHFTFEDVARAISDKLQARHPHIFGEQAERGPDDWECLKEQERAEKGETSAMDGIALALPALRRADKIQKRAARVGFDWDDLAGPAEKLREEIDELADADIGTREEEAGDVLFAAVNLVRAYKIDPEAALQKANAKFSRRFRAMEDIADGSFGSLSLDEKEALWNIVKLSEKGQNKLH